MSGNEVNILTFFYLTGEGTPSTVATPHLLPRTMRSSRDAGVRTEAGRSTGYCGADIKAVCSEAALCALRRRYPQIYSSSQKLVLDVNSIVISSKDFKCAMSKMVPAAQRAVMSPAKALIPAIRPLLDATLQTILHAVRRVFPHAEQGLKRKRDQETTLLISVSLNPLLCRSVLSQPTSYRPRLLLEGRPGSGQSSHLAPAVLHALEKFPVYTLDMAVLFGASATAPEETCAKMFVEAKRTSPSILYIPHIGQWWETVGSALRATFLSLLSSIPAFSPIVLLATCSLRYDQLMLCALEVLPVAPPPQPRQLTEEESRRLDEQEEDTLRELRLFLRDVTNRLSQDKRFKAFTKPVDLEEVAVQRSSLVLLASLTHYIFLLKNVVQFAHTFVCKYRHVYTQVPDYADVIKKPMDLSTVLSRIDLHQYGTVKEFLQDVDLIWQNALEYNPDRDPSGTTYTQIQTNMYRAVQTDTE
ncbi:hypothetical protein GOODEAATRI_017102 [Goodea atripinnis]|uniref:Bromo domain-containing protein n=1 Tax=Goodea atripinnis TaxID=208336 RepID=A0ABV0MSX5_9TELE